MICQPNYWKYCRYCGTSEKILIKLKDVTLSLLMAQVIQCLGSTIKIFSGFNIVATNLFEGFSWKEFSFTVTLSINTSLTKLIKK